MQWPQTMVLSLGEDGASAGHRSGLCRDMEDAASHSATNLVVQSAFLEMDGMGALLKTISQVSFWHRREYSTALRKMVIEGALPCSISSSLVQSGESQVL